MDICVCGKDPQLFVWSADATCATLGCRSGQYRERAMNATVGPARTGQWYTRWDKGEIFRVTDYDRKAHTIGIQTFDGDLDEIDAESWQALPLAFAEPPEDWTGPVDDVEHDDLGYSETDMKGSDWNEPLQPLRSEEPQEAWQDITAEDDRDPEGEGIGAEPLALDEPEAAQSPLA
jgi:Family of unknown function (DUF6763)